MWICRSCFRRDLQALGGLDPAVAPVSGLFFQPSLGAALFPLGPTYNPRRSHATFASIQKGHHRLLLRRALKSKRNVPPPRNEALGPTQVSRRNTIAVENNRHHLDLRKNGQNDDEDDDRDIAQEGDRGKPRRFGIIDPALLTELAWTGGDSLRLARAVLEKLKLHIPLRALDLVRASEKVSGARGSRAIDNVVSWNHIMDYFMSQSQTREAFKVFNEMKKRGHKPDAHTFTIMLRGFTMNHKNGRAVEQAMGVYDSMWRPESNVKPSTIHSNAILNCLGRALNMDALWAVAGRLPERGPGSADKWTYTTIFNSIQACAIRDARQLSKTDGDQEAAAQVMQSAIGEGRKMWEHIISRWRSGDVNIDQTLVCAMGRLLVLGQRQDWDDIFSLVEQTMRIPRVRPPREFRRKADESASEAGPDRPTPTVSGGQNEAMPELQQLEAEVSEETASKVTNEFALVDLSGRPDQGATKPGAAFPYANIGNNVLSLILEATIKLKDVSTGKKYWSRLTNPRSELPVTPDDENVHTYLRLLRLSRASKVVCELLRDPPTGASRNTFYKRATFVLAMSTCSRDFKNPKVFSHASAILDLMEVHLPFPDAQVMTMYLSLAAVTTPGVSNEMPGEFQAQADGNNLIRAVRRFSYSGLEYQHLLRRLQETEQERDEKDKEKGKEPRSSKKNSEQSHHVHSCNRDDVAAPTVVPDGLLEFMQTLNGSYDKLLRHQLKMTNQLAEELTRGKRILSRTLQAISPPNSMPRPKPSSQQEPADVLTDYDGMLRSSRFPDKRVNVANPPSEPGPTRKKAFRGQARREGSFLIAPKDRRRTTRKRTTRKRPRTVDLGKRHPFLNRKADSDSSSSSSSSSLPSSRGKANTDDRNGTRGTTSHDDAPTGTPFSSAGGWGGAWKASQRRLAGTKDKNNKEGKEWVVV